MRSSEPACSSELSWTSDPLPLLVDRSAPERWGVRVAFSKRLGGVSGAPFDSLNMSPFLEDDPSAVNANHSLFAQAASVSSLMFARQIHGDDVIQVPDEIPDKDGPCVLGEGDALTAGSDVGAGLAILTADCVPVLLVGTDAIAAVHAGWRGLVAGVIERAAEAVGDVKGAWVGPSIRACCYEVGDEVIAAFKDRDLPVADQRHVDPGRAAAVLLRRAGTPEVFSSIECTHCDPSFFSYRRDGTTGRQAAVIAWT